MWLKVCDYVHLLHWDIISGLRKNGDVIGILPAGGHQSGGRGGGHVPRKPPGRVAQSVKCIPWLWPNPLHHHVSTLLKSSPFIVRDTTGLPQKRNSRNIHYSECLHFKLGWWTSCHSCDVSIGKAWKPVCFLPQKDVQFFFKSHKQ